MKNIIESIQLKYSQKTIQSLCKKILKKHSLNSEGDIKNLHDLAFWLYIYEENKAVTEVINLTRDMSFNGKYTIWDYVHSMWALKARILRKAGKNKESWSIINSIIEHSLIPVKLCDTQEEMEKERNKELNNKKYEDIHYKENIKTSFEEGDEKSAREWMFLSVSQLIRYKEEAAYPALIKIDNQIEKDITEYIGILKMQQ